MNKEELISTFEKFSDLKVLVIGDVMIDAYMWGTVDRISPEAPIPIVSVTKRENRLGGAANVALNIKALGATPIIASVIGDDEKGKLFFELLEKSNLTDAGIITSSKRKTTTKTRVISGHQHLLRVDEEINESITKNLEKAFVTDIFTLISEEQVDAIIFEDYDKGIITPYVIEEVVKKANELKIPTLVDPKKQNFEQYKGVTLFKPNFKELVEGLKIELDKGDFEAIHEAVQPLHKEWNIKYVLTTLSELGIFISYNGSYHNMPSDVRDVADVSGAGDTVISVAALCLAAGLNPEAIASISNIAGGLVCEKVGVVPIEREKLFVESLKYLG